MATVTQTVNSCSIGIDRVTSSNEVSIYPNPASQLINLTISQFNNEKINSIEIDAIHGEAKRIALQVLCHSIATTAHGGCVK